MLVLGHTDVNAALVDRQREVIEAVRQAYILHEKGLTAVPHSVFLRFPDNDRNRIIGLPAYLGDEEPVTGMKWIASFPDNVSEGMPRASAVMVLNSATTGRPEALLEGSLISAQRTAASAALAASVLRQDDTDTGVTLIGCGLINFEILRFLLAALPNISDVTLYDIDAERLRAFGERCTSTWPDLQVSIAESATEAMGRSHLISFATTAGRPYLDLATCLPKSLILHVSLRDLMPAAILSAHNIVDDADHVCREQTSLHITEQETGGRHFINDSLGKLILENRKPEENVTIFSPFGLGVLDLAVASLALTHAQKDGLGVRVSGFLP